MIGIHDHFVTTISISPDNNLIASGSNDRTVRYWNIETKTNFVVGKHDKDVTSISFSSNGLQIASGSYDKTVRIWDLKTNDCIFKTLQPFKLNFCSSK